MATALTPPLLPTSTRNGTACTGMAQLSTMRSAFRADLPAAIQLNGFHHCKENRVWRRSVALMRGCWPLTSIFG